MDFWQVLRERRSSRQFKEAAVEENKLIKVLEAAALAPSPANRQPWEFVVVRNQELKMRIFDASNKAREHLFRVSGWRWLGKYRVDFLKQASVLVAVVGDPEKTGADRLFPGRGEGYQHACAAAVQNMLLAAQAQGLGSLWFSLYDHKEMADLLRLGQNKEVLAIVCLGYSMDDTPRPPKQDVQGKIRFMD